MTKIYSARWVMPICSPPIEHGAIAIDGDVIVSVGRAQDLNQRFPETPIRDFGLAAILPGLVNVHSHLELTAMRGFLDRQEGDFLAWLRKLTVARMAMTPDDLRVSATCGAIEGARAGVTCLGDASSLARSAMKALTDVGLRGVVYQESFGPDPTTAGQNVANLRKQLSEMRTLETALVRAGVSPHAPYTVSAPQLELIARLALDEKLPLMMHAAESQAETLFMFEGVGPFAEGLKKRGIEWQAPGISTIAYLQRHGLLETKPLLAHCITVDNADLELIRKSQTAIAHCPKSNAKLGHGRAPFASFLSYELNVGLGSDSVASNNTCDILEEARFATLLARSTQSVGESEAPTLAGPKDLTQVLTDDRVMAPISRGQALFAATLGGARALCLDHQIGSLEEGKQADIAIVSLAGMHQQPVRDPADALIFSSSGRDVLLTMTAGKEIYQNGSVTTIDDSAFQSELEAVRAKLDSSAIS
jgi:cytosine/adenosine deaminase-related metal-dependent hydrolase